MKNLESFENFKNEEVVNLDTAFGGALYTTKWTDGTNTGSDLWDSDTGRLAYIE